MTFMIGFKTVDGLHGRSLGPLMGFPVNLKSIFAAAWSGHWSGTQMHDQVAN